MSWSFPDTSQKCPGIVQKIIGNILNISWKPLGKILDMFVDMSWNVSETFPCHVQDIPWTFPGQVPRISCTCPRNVLEISRTFRRHFPDMFRKRSGDVLEMIQQTFMNILKLILDISRTCPGRVLKMLWNVTGKFLVVSWKLPGSVLETWKAFQTFLRPPGPPTTWEKQHVRDQYAQNLTNYQDWSHILILVNFQVLNFFGVVVMTRHHGSFERHHLVGILPTGLPELYKLKFERSNRKKTKILGAERLKFGINSSNLT